MKKCTGQSQLQIPNVMYQLRLEGKVGNAELTTLDNIQLVAGYVTPVLEGTLLRLDCIDQG